MAPFNITLATATLLAPTPASALLLEQEVFLSSARQLLQARLQVTLDVTEHHITKLDVLEIDTSADQELGTWLRSPTSNNDLPTIGKAFGRYYDESKNRAECFRDSELEFDTLLSSKTSSTGLGQDVLVSYFGRQHLSFSRELVTLKIAWLVSIKDDGEVGSSISAEAKFPGAWQRTAGGDNLMKVGNAFDMLVKDRGAKEAIRVVCSLMFPS